MGDPDFLRMHGDEITQHPAEIPGLQQKHKPPLGGDPAGHRMRFA